MTKHDPGNRDQSSFLFLFDSRRKELSELNSTTKKQLYSYSE